MELIVGLGNPGNEYKNTRHNVGFMVINELSIKYNINGKFYPKFNAIIGKGTICNKEILIVQPVTYMNLSGQAVLSILNWYKIDPNKLFVVFDDINLNLGKIRFRPSGSHGGHNGIKSIINSLGNFKDFSRLKIGIGPDPGGNLRHSYVLEKFTEPEKKLLNKIFFLCVEGIETFLTQGIEEARNKFNGINQQ
ncbi:MAG: aminoacyl-tRNA hydrolase [bacterium]